jgi:outer membrane protein assembly factor BamE (lipoprotein component of BamABCDE complex)
MQKDEFLKLCGEPSKTQTVGNKTSWYYTCKDGEIQLELDKGNLLGGIVAGQVNDY